MTCERIAQALGVLGVILAGATLAFDGEAISRRRLLFETSAGDWRLVDLLRWHRGGGVPLRLRAPLTALASPAVSQVTDDRLWHPWLRINRLLRVMLHTHWSAEQWSVVRVEFRKALALRSEIRRAGWFNQRRGRRSP